jgi:hypothetical protein
MRAIRLAAATALTGAVFALSPAYAETVWDFTTKNGNQGQSEPYVCSICDAGPQIITAGAFGAPGQITGPAELFGKIFGLNEDGLGLTNDPHVLENEISVGSFIQLDLSQVVFAPGSTTMSFQAQSTTNGEGWQVWGTNIAGTIGSGDIPAGAVLLGSCISAPGSVAGNPCEVQTNILGAAAFTFLDVTAINGPGTIGSNILLNHVDAVTDPVPIVGAGLPGLLAACGGLLVLARRRRKQAS